MVIPDPSARECDHSIQNNQTKNVCILSWNSRGSSQQKLDFFNYLVSPQIVGDKIPILCNQENFILKGNSYRLFQALPNFHFFINPAIKNIQDHGRPKNGMFIGVPNSIKSFVQDVSPNHWRVQAVTISSNLSKTLLINSYFPIDKRDQENNENNEDFIETIGVIQNVIRNNQCDSIVWAGDINCDFSRNTFHSRTVEETLNESKFSIAWNNFNIDFTCTYEREGVTYISTLDHFFFSEQLNLLVTDAGVIHHPDNTSDHSPIYCVLESLTINPSVIKASQYNPRPSWKRATQYDKNMYKYVLETKLNAIAIPTQITECSDVHCNDEVHRQAIDWFATEVLEAVQTAAEETLPIPKISNEKDKQKITPGFNEQVKPFKEKAYFWHCVWKSAGRPLNTNLHKIMKKTRNVYHMEFKKCQKAETTIRKSKLLDACINGNGELFKEIKAMRRTKPLVADTIDGEKKEISNHFRNIYKELYNCVNDGEEVMKIKEEIEENINQNNLDDIKRVTPTEVKKAASKLKPGKGDPTYDFSSDCIKINSDIFNEYIAVMIKGFLIHSHIPIFMLLSTLVPIIKDKLGSINTSKNYRSVCITSLILKLIDWIIVNLFGDALGFHDLQFAYQQGVSSNMCSWAVVETINYFLRNESDIFSCSMDKSKAFDLCQFSTLFRKMMKKISLVFVRLIIFMYVNQFSNVRWNSEISASFVVSNGVGQGKILAGFGYCFYCFDLFEQLKLSGYGCKINGVYAGIFGYSDDDILLSPSISGLQGMLQIAESFALNHGLKFSTDPDPKKSKTKCIAWMNSPRPLPKMKLCGNYLPWVSEILHLGNVITNDTYLLESDMKRKNAKYVSRNIEINQEFYFAASETKMTVNDIWNSSWYGSVIWDLFCPSAVKLESSWNRSIKIMLNLPYATHRGLLETLSGRKHLKRLLIKRFIQFISKIKISSKPILNTLLSAIRMDTRSTTGKNLRQIMIISGKLSIEDIDTEDSNFFEYFPRPVEDDWKSELIKIMMDEREQGNLDETDQELMDYLCTN